jgi:hypothetical protein
MKKMIILFALPLVLLLSCGDEGKDFDNVKRNELLIDGNSMSVPKAYVSQKYSRQDGSGNPGNGFYITIAEGSVFVSNNGTNDVFDGDGFSFIIGLAAASSEFLLPGTYSLPEGDPSFPFIFYGQISEIEDGTPGWSDVIRSGTVTVSKSGSTYTIEIDVMLLEKRVKAYYHGLLEDVHLGL